MIAAATSPARFDQPLAGFRCWARQLGGSHLAGVTWPTRWALSGINEAACGGEALTARWGCRKDLAPNLDCSCGIYAYSDLLLALAYVRRNLFRPPWEPGRSNRYVVGAVLLWGQGERRVLAGQVDEPAIRPGGDGLRGLRYRAPFARVLALLDPEAPGDPALSIGRAYGLPVLPARGLELYAREHGRVLTAEEVAR